MINVISQFDPHYDFLILGLFLVTAEYVRKYANEDAIREVEKESSEKNQSANGNGNLSSDSESSMSDFSEDEARDMEL